MINLNNPVKVTNYNTKKKGELFKYRVVLPQVNGVRPKELAQRGFKTADEAFEAGWKAYKEWKEYQGRIDENSLTFKDFAEKQWWSSFKINKQGEEKEETTMDYYANLLKTVIYPLLGDYPIAKLESQFLLQVMQKKAEEYANIKQVKSTVNNIFNRAVAAKVIPFNPMLPINDEIKPIKKAALKKKRQNEKRWLEPNEIVEILKITKKDWTLENNIMDYVILRIALFTGVRKSEVYALTWNRVNFEDKTITFDRSLSKKSVLKTTKTKKNTEIAVDDDLIDLLKIWKHQQAKILLQVGINANNPEQFLFTYMNNKGEINVPVHIDYLNYRINTLKRNHPELTYLEHFTPHGTRHSWATIMGGTGIDDTLIQQQLGHTDIRTTRETYMHNAVKTNRITQEIFTNTLKNAL
jgi:integrase